MFFFFFTTLFAVNAYFQSLFGIVVVCIPFGLFMFTKHFSRKGTIFLLLSMILACIVTAHQVKLY